MPNIYFWAAKNPRFVRYHYNKLNKYFGSRNFNVLSTKKKREIICNENLDGDICEYSMKRD